MNGLDNREKIINIKYAALQFLAWGMYCVEISFISTYCTYLGYTSGEVGTIVGLAYALSIAVQQLVAAFLDRFRKYTTNQCLVVMTLVKMGLLFWCFLIDRQNLTYSILRIVIAAICMAYEPILSAYSGIFSFNSIRVSYSFGRGMGSLGYALIAALSGRMIASSPKSIYALMFAVAIINLIAVFWISREKFEDARSHMDEKNAGKGDDSFFQMVLQNKVLIAILFASMFAIGANCSYSTFLVQLVYDNGGNSVSYGNLTAFAAMTEIISFVCFDKIRGYFKMTHLLKFSVLCFTLKHLILLFSKNLVTMYLAMIFQPLGFALMTSCLVSCVLEMVGLRHVNKGQALLGAFQRAGSVLGTITCGLLAEAYSIRFTFGVICGFCTIALVIVLLFVKQTPRRGYLD